MPVRPLWFAGKTGMLSPVSRGLSSDKRRVQGKPAMTWISWIRRHRRGLFRFALVSIAVYVAVPVLILSLGLDRVVLGHSHAAATHEQRLSIVMTQNGRGLAVRRYGEGRDGRCVVFFPGQHGGMARYEHDLLPMLRMSGYAVYAISYPGQDGAPGRATLDDLPGDVGQVLGVLVHDRSCDMRRSIFVGRSFGASVAIMEAARFRPKGILVEGLAPDLATAIRAWMRRHAISWLWQWLPVKTLVPGSGDLKPVLDGAWSGMPMVVFQGTEDDVTPFEDAQALMAGRVGVKFIPVPGGLHENTFLVAGPAYRGVLVGLAGE